MSQASLIMFSHLGSNLGPHTLESSALPLSYILAPFTFYLSLFDVRQGLSVTQAALELTM